MSSPTLPCRCSRFAKFPQARRRNTSLGLEFFPAIIPFQAPNFSLRAWCIHRLFSIALPSDQNCDFESARVLQQPDFSRRESSALITCPKTGHYVMAISESNLKTPSSTPAANTPIQKTCMSPMFQPSSYFTSSTSARVVSLIRRRQPKVNFGAIPSVFPSFNPSRYTI